MARIVSWWSAGAASTVAASLAHQIPGDEHIVAYCDTSSTEHPDALRFLADCERVFGWKIERLRSKKFTDTWDVWRKTGWLVGIGGARCTTELKKLVRREFERPDDIQVFGFTSEEQDRADLFKRNNPEINARFPLIERGLSKADCHAVLDKHGIKPHAMYGLGYKNANCLGCVKGGIGYWNKVRVDFPEVFDRMAKLERELDVAILKDRRGGVRKRLFLDELPPGTGRYEKEPSVECGLVCGSVYEETAATLACDDDDQ